MTEAQRRETSHRSRTRSHPPPAGRWHPSAWLCKQVIYFACLCPDMQQRSSRLAALLLLQTLNVHFFILKALTDIQEKPLQTLKTYSFQLGKSIPIMASVGESIMRKRQSNHRLMETTSGLLSNSFLVFSSHYNANGSLKISDGIVNQINKYAKFLSLFIGLNDELLENGSVFVFKKTFLPFSTSACHTHIHLLDSNSLGSATFSC